MDWQQLLVTRLVNRIEHHALLSDLEPYRQQLELAAIENPVDRFALESAMYRLWQTWHQGFDRHAAVLDDAVRTHLTETDIAALGEKLVAAVPVALFGRQSPARYAWVILTGVLRYQIQGETPAAPTR